MEYDQVSHLVRTGGTVFFFSVFVLVLAYVFWPKNREEFKKASSLALHDDKPIPDTHLTPNKER